MNFTDVVRMSMEKFLSGELVLNETAQLKEGRVKYTPEFFDILEEDLKTAEDTSNED